MSEVDVKFLEVPFQRVVIGDDDCIVLNCEQPLSLHAHEVLIKKAKRVFGIDRDIIVMSGGVTISAIAEEPQEGEQ